jgi:phage shock protein C
MNIPNEIKWTRSSTDSWVSGVCAGIAKNFDIEPWVVRALLLVSIFWFGTGILFYAVAAICLPKDNNLQHAYDRKISGVCAEIAARNNLEPGLVRIAACFIGFFSFGLAILIYFVLAVTMPKGISANGRKA